MSDDVTSESRRRPTGDDAGTGTGPAAYRLARARRALAEAEAAAAAEGSRDPGPPPRLRALDGGATAARSADPESAWPSARHPASRATGRRDARLTLQVIEGGEGPARDTPASPARSTTIAAASWRGSPSPGAGAAPGSGTGERSQPDEDADPAEDAEADPLAVARRIVVRALAAAPRSRGELVGRLRQRRCPEDVIDVVLAELQEKGLVDDADFAATFVRSRRQSKALGKRALAHELRAKGVDPELVDAEVGRIEPHEEEEQARVLVRHRLGGMGGLEREVRMRRLAGVLARKGYPGALALRVIREELDLDPELGRD